MSARLPILVTGAAGFIGARFVESCNKAGVPVVSVDLSPHFAERTEHRGVGFGTIVDREKLFDWLGGSHAPSKFEAIVHLGACANTMETDEAYLNRVNVEYSQHLWKYATATRTPFVYASSAATYGAGEQGYVDDEKQISRLQPLNLYGLSKQKFDLWALQQEQKGDTPPTWAGFKFFNVYGFGERHKGKMASVVLHAYDQIRASGQMKLFQSHRAGIRDGYQKRDFIYVDDVVDVLHFAYEKPIRRGIYNLGTGHARPFVDLARNVFTALRRPELIEFVPTPESIREKYQYFTEAKMDRLRAQGFTRPFMALEQAVPAYLKRLETAK